MSRWSILLVLLLAACERTRVVTVIAAIPGTGQARAANFMLVALPYDRDSLVAAFEARAARPAPATAALDSLFARYRAPFAAYTAILAETNRLGDSLAVRKQRLDTMPRTGAEYREAYAAWTALRDSLRALDLQVAKARAALEAARPAFVARSESLRAVVRAWQDSTYRGYDAAVDTLVQRSHRTPVADTTDAAGVATLELRGGPWWIYARSWDPRDPNAEWYWNVRVAGDTVLLDAASGQNRPRY